MRSYGDMEISNENYFKNENIMKLKKLLYTRSVQEVSSLVLWKIRDIFWRIYKIQETLYTGQWHLSVLQSRHLGTSHSSPNRHQLPHCIFLHLLPFKGNFSFGKSQKLQGTKSGLQGAGGLSHLGDLIFCQKTLHQTWCMSGHIVLMKLPITRGP